MNVMLLGMAALAAVALPASSAQAQSLSGFTAGNGVRSDRGFDIDFRSSDRRSCFDGDRRGGRDSRGRRGSRQPVCDVIAGGWYGGEWALYNNRGWESDSYNDWWHDRPDRAYPRWVGTNQNCERQWWSGGGWRC